MRKVYYLSTCSTSKRIIADLSLRDKGFEFQDIKVDKIAESQLEEMHRLAGSYEQLFSKISRKYKELGLKEKQLNEADFKAYILDEYTFLKRPVVIIDKEIFIGSSKPNLAKLESRLSS